MPRKRERCNNCGKPMRRLYMQKNKATGSRGMVATGWLCEECNFSDLITRFQEDKTSAGHHPALMCKCEMCGTTHDKGLMTGDEKIDIAHILKKSSIDRLILINNLEEASKYQGLVLGTFIWDTGESQQVAKAVYLKHATSLQREVIDSIWNDNWRRKGWQPILQGKRFKKKVQKSSIDFEQILGMGIILNQRVTDSTFDAIGMIKSPGIYVDTSIESGNSQLAEEYAKKAKDEGDSKVAGKYMHVAIKGGNTELLEDYVRIRGQEAAALIIELIDQNRWRLDDNPYRYSYTGDQVLRYYDALSETGSPEAALFLVKDSFKENLRSQIGQIGDEDSKDPVISALGTLPASSYYNRTWEHSNMVAALVANMDDYGPLEFLLESYNEPEEAARLFKEVMASTGDYEKTRIFISEAAGFNSIHYKNYLLKKVPDGIRKFLFSEDPGLRLMGISMGKSEELDAEIKEFIFMMSFLDAEESVREGAAELVKENGISQVTGMDSKELIDILFPFGPIVNWRGAPPRSRDFNKREEFLERLIYYEGKQFLPLILEHVQPDSETNTKLDLFLKSFDKNETVEMLFDFALEKAPEACARNAIMKALALDEPKTYGRIKDMIMMRTGKERTERKKAVNRRLMFIEIFARNATAKDLPHIQELMKKDRSPRAKRKFAELIMKINT